MGAAYLVIYVADYEQAALLPLPGAGVPGRQALSMEGTLGGLAYRRVDTVRAARAEPLAPLWIPVLDGVERLGVAEVGFTAPPSEELLADISALLALTAELIVVNGAYSDFFARVRRRKLLSLAAEIQWDLLPPLAYGADRIVITGGLEPAYDIGGDTFDYAVNGDVADLMVLDAVGHGLPAAVLASVAVGAYRHARRNLLDLPDMCHEINEALAQQFGNSQFATGVLARLDLETGRLRWINAGHPPPLILRGSSLVRPPACSPARPLGLQETKAVCCDLRLEPGDRLLLYTDGITEARSPDGQYFGEARLIDFVTTAATHGDPAPETVRRLMRRVLAHQADRLQDDASLVMLEWRAGTEAQLLA
ncbi:PP2C family protein-serine/threonine phosphatase [Geodermatophilus nigrescens]